tara:strand:+ start:4464 stop:5363 length:900 start_codon:yes stop_codon:yes gene_type:complete
MKKLFENWRRYTYLAEATQWSQYQRVMDMLRGDVDAVDEISILTPENPHAKKDYPQEQNDARTELFLGMMSSAGFGYRQIDGMYDNAEVSYVVPHMSIDEAAKYSYMFGQESFVYSVKQDAEKPMLHQLIVIDGYENAEHDPQYDESVYGKVYSLPSQVEHHVDVESNDLVEFGELADEKNYFSNIPDKSYVDPKTKKKVTKKGPRFKMDFYPDEPKTISRGKPRSPQGSGPRYPVNETYIIIDINELPKTKESKKLVENIKKRTKLIKQKDRTGKSKHHHRKMIIQEKKKLKKIMEEK